MTAPDPADVAKLADLAERYPGLTSFIGRATDVAELRARVAELRAALAALDAGPPRQRRPIGES